VFSSQTFVEMFRLLDGDSQQVTLQLLHKELQSSQPQEMTLMDMAAPGNEEHLIEWMKEQESHKKRPKRV
jgi:hypothetical protein